MIPKIIHRTVPRETTELMDYCWETVKKYTPDYIHMTHYDDDEYKYIKDVLPLCKRGAFRADLIRLEVLYRYGGIYIDSDLELYKNIDSFLNSNLFVCKEDNWYIINAVIGASPQNEHILNLLKISKNIIKQGGLEPPYLFKSKELKIKMAFGPHVFHNYLKNKTGINVIDSENFGTFWHNEKIKGIYGTHICAGSWTKEEEN
jgi:mannosyltransferase OCH1-like enzyme